MTDGAARAVVRLMGGLGNQLFQVAHAWDLHTQGKAVWLDAGWFDRHGSSTGRTLDASPVFGELPVLSRVRSTMLVARMRWRRHPDAALDSVVRVGRTDVHLGYWQDRVTVDGVRDALGPLTAEAVRRASGTSPLEPAVAVHVRHGDYARPETRSFHGLTDPRQQLEIARELADEFDLSRIVIFTDSPSALASLLAENPDLALSSAISAWDVLAGLSRARALVMSNSSLSWWGATLADWTAPGYQTAVCPHPWLATPSAADNSLVRPEWRTFNRRLK